MDFTEVQGVARVYSDSYIVGQTGTDYHESNIFAFQTLKDVNQMVDSLASLSYTHSANEQNYLFERNAKLPFDHVLALVDLREFRKVEGVVGHECLRPEAKLDQSQAVLRVENQSIADSMNIVENMISNLTALCIPIASFGPPGERNSPQLKPMY